MTRIALKPLTDQVVVITGAISGIGLVTAKMAAARGATVMLIARNRDALANAVEAIVAAGGTAAFAVADVADRDSLTRAAEHAIEHFGRIDTWINGAAVAIYAKLVDTPTDEHERLFATNYFGVVNGCLTAIPHLRNGGALLTVASIGAELPTPVIGAYAASKHAVKAYVEALRMELHADQVPIAVTLIKPSGIDTPIAQHAANHGYGDIKGEALIPLPVYAPELVAEAIYHAAEHARRNITVGGVGRMNVLVGQHFPWLLDMITPRLVETAFDPSRAKTTEASLFQKRAACDRVSTNRGDGASTPLANCIPLLPPALGSDCSPAQPFSCSVTGTAISHRTPARPRDRPEYHKPQTRALEPRVVGISANAPRARDTPR